MSSVVAAEKGRTALASLAPLFAWPDDAFEQRVADAVECLTSLDVEGGRSLREFAQQMFDVNRAEREITYTATFDLAPSCSPYLSVHRFGEDNQQQRAGLMNGLQSVIAARVGETPYRELPDHIAVVLALAPHFTEDEWLDLLTLVLQPALAKMEKALDESRNPYRHLVSAARSATAAASREGGIS